MFRSVPHHLEQCLAHNRYSKIAVQLQIKSKATERNENIHVWHFYVPESVVRALRCIISFNLISPWYYAIILLCECM